MKFLLLSMGIIEFDGRLKELEKVFKSLGQVVPVYFSISRSEGVYVKTSSNITIYGFLRMAIHCVFNLRKMLDADVLVIDNYLSSFFGYLLTKLFKPKVIIYDMRELYVDDHQYSFKTKFFLKYERYFISHSDIVIVANDLRKTYVEQNLSPNGRVLVFENVRFLPDPESNVGNLDGLDAYKFKIVSTGGYSVSRGTDILMERFTLLPKDYVLYIIGGGYLEGKRKWEDLGSPDNIKFVNKITMMDLSSILSKMDIGLVHYSYTDTNNQLCASGKTYEYIGRGIPVVTTEHETLKKFCKDSEAGVADDGFVNGIIQLSNELDKYKLNAKFYSNLDNIKNYTAHFALELRKVLNIFTNSL